MNPLELAQQFLAGGAVLTLNGRSILLVPMSTIERRGPNGWRLVYHDLNVPDQHGTHVLGGPIIEAEHALGVTLRCSDGASAYLCPASEHSDEAAEAVATWRADIAAGRLDADFFADSIRERLAEE